MQPRLPLRVTAGQLQQLLSHDTAFTKAYGFVVTTVESGSCTLEVPHLPHFERPGGSPEEGAGDRPRAGITIRPT